MLPEYRIKDTGESKYLLPRLPVVDKTAELLNDRLTSKHKDKSGHLYASPGVNLSDQRSDELWIPLNAIEKMEKYRIHPNQFYIWKK